MIFEIIFCKVLGMTSSFKYPIIVKINMVKISVKKGWSTQSKLGVMGLVGSIVLIIAVVLLD